MLGVTIFTVIISIVLSGVQGFVYSFDEDYVEKCSKKYCDYKSDWRLIDYASFGKTHSDGDTVGILAAKNSCITTSPILVHNGSNLEVNVYMQVTSKSSNISVVLTEELSGFPVKTYGINGSVKLMPEWSKITIPVEVTAVVRISLLAHILDDEVIIVNYIKYTPPIIKGSRTDESVQKKGEAIENTANKDQNGSEETTNVDLNAYSNYPKTNKLLIENNVNSLEFLDAFFLDSLTSDVLISDENSDTTYDPTTDSDITNPTTDSEITEENTEIETLTTTEAVPEITPTEATETETRPLWDDIMIMFIVAGSLMGVAIISISCYYFGKRNGKKPVIIVNAADDVDLPRTVVIPRVKDVSGQSLPSYY